MAIKMLRTKSVYGIRCRSRAAHYCDINDGLFPPPIPISERARATPEYEVDVITSARISGKSDDEIRQIVKTLVAFRKKVVGKTDDEIRAMLKDLFAANQAVV